MLCGTSPGPVRAQERSRRPRLHPSVGAVAGVALGGALAVLVAVPLAWKWKLGAPRATAVVCMVAAVVGVAVAVIGDATNLDLP